MREFSGTFEEPRRRRARRDEPVVRGAPAVVLDAGDEACAHWVLVDVAKLLLELVDAPDHAIEAAAALPEGSTGPFDEAGGEAALELREPLADRRRTRREEQVHVVAHDDPRVEFDGRWCDAIAQHADEVILALSAIKEVRAIATREGEEARFVCAASTTKPCAIGDVHAANVRAKFRFSRDTTGSREIGGDVGWHE